jgi:hypothetical protein
MFSCGKAACRKTVAAQPQQKNVHRDTLWYNSNENHTKIDENFVKINEKFLTA